MEETNKFTLSNFVPQDSAAAGNESTQNDKITSAPEKHRKKSSLMSPVHTFFLNIRIIITAVWLLFGFVFGFFSAPNNDMSPNIKAGDLMLYYRLDHRYSAQDIIVLKKNQTTYVGRIVAKGGDTVDITDSDQLVINGDVVLEDNVYASTPRIAGTLTYPLTLGENEYFVLSDGRAGSEDIRYYGVISESEVNGKVVTLMRRNHL